MYDVQSVRSAKQAACNQGVTKNLPPWSNARFTLIFEWRSSERMTMESGMFEAAGPVSVTRRQLRGVLRLRSLTLAIGTGLSPSRLILKPRHQKLAEVGITVAIWSFVKLIKDWIFWSYVTTCAALFFAGEIAFIWAVFRYFKVI